MKKNSEWLILKLHGCEHNPFIVRKDKVIAIAPNPQNQLQSIIWCSDTSDPDAYFTVDQSTSSIEEQL